MTKISSICLRNHKTPNPKCRQLLLLSISTTSSSLGDFDLLAISSLFSNEVPPFIELPLFIKLLCSSSLNIDGLRLQALRKKMSKNDNWSEEETRYFFQLYADERKKGNRTSIGMNKTGKAYIIKKFEERFQRGYNQWNPFKNRYDACKKKYATFRLLTHNRTVRYDDMGKLEMPDDWWEQRAEEWPAARKFKSKVVANMDVYEEEFRSVVVTGGEGWSAQTGEASLNSTVNGDDDDEADSVDKDMVEKQTQTQTQTQTQAGTSKAKKRRTEKDKTVEAVIRRTEVLDQKNRIAEQMLEREHASSVENVVEMLNGLPGVRMWSPFHEEYHVDEEDEEEEEEEEEGEGEEGEEGEEEEEHVAYEPTGDRAMEALRDNITNECNKGRLPY